MNCKINCSFGEIVDKYTILNLKKSKTDDVNKLKNINNEINILKKDNPLVDTENLKGTNNFVQVCLIFY